MTKQKCSRREPDTKIEMKMGRRHLFVVEKGKVKMSREKKKKSKLLCSQGAFGKYTTVVVVAVIRIQ